ncbi:NAD(P)-binding domain-containing protein [Paraflavitalea speifideaquila]|uniref:NAD(P)-binding domain-containing protein n=1 Tax=Paraflavitalea speifideaquila TaxID=3076558 RepID=UPI0028E7308F|nr:NAD(P)-binding domain-containing protein [Paraflavitalea speifideiaquila]
MSVGVIGSGSWATALAKILTDNKNPIHWYIRKEGVVKHLQQRHHNPHYLHSVYFDTSLLTLSTDVASVVANSDCVLIAVPSAYLLDTLQQLDKNAFKGKRSSRL